MNNKKIATASWLAKKAMSLMKRDPEEYERLITGGSEKVLSGTVVKLDCNSHNSTPSYFAIRVKGKEEYCRVFSVRHKEKLYSFYSFHFTATQYRKRLTDKYLPITLPEGVKCRTYVNSPVTKCLYHNADGSLAMTGVWKGGGRGRPGVPSSHVVLNDETGAFVDDRELVHKVIAGCMNQSVQANYQFFHAASKKRSEWLRSFECMTGMCDMKKVLKIAAETYRMASRMCERHKGLSLTLFPAAMVDKFKVESRLQSVRVSGMGGRQTVLARDENHNPTLCYLPEVVLSWDERFVTSEYGSAWGGIVMQIVPHGNALLDPIGYGSQLSRHYRTLGDVPRGEPLRAVTDKSVLLERAYHSLEAYDPATPIENRGGLHRYWGWAAYGEKHVYSEDENKIVLWPKHRDKVRVIGFGTGFDQLFEQEDPVAETPENISLLLEEKLLMGSLPLC